MPLELSDAAFLLRVGWTWAAYLETPDDVIEGMLILMQGEAEATKEATEKSNG